MKKLVIEEIKDKNGETIKIKIIEQSHRCFQFGVTNNMFCHELFSLSSRVFPEVKDNRLYVRGTDEGKDNNILDVPSKDWLRKMKKTVKVYNEYFYNCNGCVERRCNSCELDGKK